MVREKRSHMTHSTVKKEKISKIPLPSEPPPTPLPLIGPGKSWPLNPRRFLIPSQTCFSDTSLPASWRCSQELTLLWCSSSSFHSSEQLFLCPSCYTQAAPVGLQPLENLQVVLLPGESHDPTPVGTHQAGCLSAEKGLTGPRRCLAKALKWSCRVSTALLSNHAARRPRLRLPYVHYWGPQGLLFT